MYRCKLKSYVLLHSCSSPFPVEFNVVVEFPRSSPGDVTEPTNKEEADKLNVDEVISKCSADAHLRPEV